METTSAEVAFCEPSASHFTVRMSNVMSLSWMISLRLGIWKEAIFSSRKMRAIWSFTSFFMLIGICFSE